MRSFVVRDKNSTSALLMPKVNLNNIFLLYFTVHNESVGNHVALFVWCKLPNLSTEEIDDHNAFHQLLFLLLAAFSLFVPFSCHEIRNLVLPI